MSERFSGAIEELETELQEQLQDVSSTKKLINALLKKSGKPPRYTDTSVETLPTSRPRIVSESSAALPSIVGSDKFPVTVPSKVKLPAACTCIESS